jgi:hypothetical protein
MKFRFYKPAILVLLFCLGAFLSFPVRADVIDETSPGIDTMTPEKMVNAYYSRCLNTVFQSLAPETRQEFCACTSAHIKNGLRQADLETMATGKGRPVDSKALAINVMAPCMAAPIEELEYNDCMTDISYAHYFKTDDAYNANCHCISRGISQFIGNYGGDLMALLVKIDAGYADDPVASIRQSGQYVGERGKLHSDCLNKYTGQ